MNGKAIIYPYWENEARGYEDIIALITVFMILFLLYPVVFFIIMLRRYWKHKNWTFKDIFRRLADKAERFIEKQRMRRSSNKDNEWEEHP
jgi:hypothetical protein